MTEKVLVFKTSIFKGIGKFQGYTLEVEKYLSSILNSADVQLIDRNIAEQNFCLKQLISYVVLRSGDNIFSYVRGKSSTEDRLVGMRSIGLGGHIEQGDCDLSFPNRIFFLTAARREVAEEVQINSPYQEQLVALINDDSTDVGKVHLGILFVFHLDEPCVTEREKEIRQARFFTIKDLKMAIDELEPWSQIALSALEDIGTTGGKL